MQKTDATFQLREIVSKSKFLALSRPNFSLRFNRNRVVLLLFESKPTEKREQNDWRSEKNLDGGHEMEEED